MTAIIIIVVVALVFFVTVCVVTFMVWKRETEIRTDSIRAIESNLEKLGDRLTGDVGSSGFASENSDFDRETLRGNDMNSRSYQNARRRTRSRDPFAWIRENGKDSLTETDTGNTTETAADGEAPEFSADDKDDIKEEAVAASAEIYERTSDGAETGARTEDSEQEAQTADLQDDLIDLIDSGDAHGASEAKDQPGEYKDEKNDTDYISQIDEFEIEMPEISVESEDYGKANDSGEDGPESALDEMITPELQNDISNHKREEYGRHARDIGRSGKKYTSEELDMLIKE